MSNTKSTLKFNNKICIEQDNVDLGLYDAYMSDDENFHIYLNTLNRPVTRANTVGS